jgi:hypothetical protein
MKSSASIALVTSLVLAACGGPGGNPTTDAAPVGFMGARWSATLNPVAGSPAPEVSGTATVMGNADSTQTRVDIAVSGATPGAEFPWHLHRGTCGDDQGIVGEAASYQQLRVGINGRATGNATLDIPMPRAGEYMINIHASPTDLGTIVACGNLTGPNGG